MTIGQELQRRRRGCVDNHGGRPSPRRTALLPVLLASTFLADSVSAQTAEPPPVFRSVDENGVDLVSRELRIDDEILTVGEGVTAMSVRLLGSLAGVWHNFQGKAGWEDDGNGNWYAQAYFEDAINTFPDIGSNVRSEQGDGATLTATSGAFLWTRSDGTIISFDRTISPYGPNYGWPTEIAYPGGRKVRIHYKMTGGALRIQSVTNNRRRPTKVQLSLRDQPDRVQRAGDQQCGRLLRSDRRCLRRSQPGLADGHDLAHQSVGQRTECRHGHQFAKRKPPIQLHGEHRWRGRALAGRHKGARQDRRTTSPWPMVPALIRTTSR